MNDDQRDGRQAMLEVLRRTFGVVPERDGRPMVDQLRGALTNAMRWHLNCNDGVTSDHIDGAVKALHEIGVALAMRAAELRPAIADETDPLAASLPDAGVMLVPFEGMAAADAALAARLREQDQEPEEHSPTLVSPAPVLCRCGQPATRAPLGDASCRTWLDGGPPICDAEACAESVGHAIGLYERLESLRAADALLAHAAPAEALWHCASPACPGLPHHPLQIAHPCGTRESSR